MDVCVLAADKEHGALVRLDDRIRLDQDRTVRRPRDPYPLKDGRESIVKALRKSRKPVFDQNEESGLGSQFPEPAQDDVVVIGDRLDRFGDAFGYA